MCFVLETIPICRVPRPHPLLNNETVSRLELNESSLMKMTIYTEAHFSIMLLDLITNTMLTLEVSKPLAAVTEHEFFLLT